MAKTLFFSGLITETSSFSDIPVTLRDYLPDLRRGPACFQDDAGSIRPSAQPLFDFAARHGLDVVAGLTTSSPVGAPTQHRDYAQLRDEILDALTEAMPVSAVFLSLHGAMMSTECDDCEGDILACVRHIVGPATPIGVVLDPHAHLTAAMVDNADIMAFLKEYPHIDGLERTLEVLAIMGGMLEGRLRPTPAVFDSHLIGFFPTQNQPMRKFVDGLHRHERADRILSVSFVHGFPWGDMPDAGAKVLVYTDDDLPAARALAQTIHDEIWAIKDRTMPPVISIREAIGLCMAPHERPLVLADLADNPGGGAPSDSTFLLHAVLEAGVEGVAIGLVYDPQAVIACHQVGPGGQLHLRIGGKTSRFSGMPIDLEAEVVNVATNAMMDVAEGARFPMGDTAWIRARGVDIVLSSLRLQMYAPAGFSHLGLDPASRGALIVKSSNHFQAFFQPIAGQVVYVNTPGAIDFDFASLPYQRVSKPFYPRCADPFAHAATPIDEEANA
jgi:microcystin degradation protein MlrC